MHTINSNSGIQEPLLPTPVQQPLEEALSGVSAGRDVTPYYNNNAPFLYLPELTQLEIVRYLGLREVTRLAKVCRYFRDLVKDNNALGRAWNRRFPSPYLDQLKATLKTKDEQQLRNWLEPFANKGTVETLIEQRKNIYFPLQLLFTNSQLMSLCRKFELVETLKITHGGKVREATFSSDGQHLATASSDHTAKIYCREANGSWEVKDTITHNRLVSSASFSSDGRYLVTACDDGTAKIHGLEDHGSWEEKACISHKNYINSATFSADSRRVVTHSSHNTVKIIGRRNNDSWEVEDTFHRNLITSATLSPDGRHMIIFASRDCVIEIHGQLDSGLWVVTSTIKLEDPVFLANFSPNSCHLILSTSTHSNDAAIIYDLQADGSWKEMDTIEHNGLIQSVNFSADCRHVVTASDDKMAKIHSQNAGSWEEKACIKHYREVTSANFSADCQHVVTTSDDTAKIISLQTGGSWALKARIVHQDQVASATFSADACHVLTASVDGVVKIYGLETNGSWLRKAFIQKEEGLAAASFSPDSRNVMTVCKDNTVRITELRKKY
ncbi:F-box/WD repeat-containing protein [Endozoicomonas sp. ONNA1]|uniref:F-box/WD repeat-containing protein n=2 Tax=unclassified Endozoicomonas TaxID=2644528 RepID=UPI0021499900|nr:F-box/WD-40 repeat-containing protein [Endozoicomonas sp. ONNA1]